MVGTVEAYNVRTVALVKNSEFCDNLFLHGGLHLQMDHLLGHDGARRDVANAMHHACKRKKTYLMFKFIPLHSSWLTSIAGSELRMLLEVVVALEFADLVLQPEKHFKPLFLLIIHARDSNFLQLLDHVAVAEEKSRIG